jgi:hypothetical protein
VFCPKGRAGGREQPRSRAERREWNDIAYTERVACKACAEAHGKQTATGSPHGAAGKLRQTRKGLLRKAGIQNAVRWEASRLTVDRTTRFDPAMRLERRSLAS